MLYLLLTLAAFLPKNPSIPKKASLIVEVNHVLTKQGAVYFALFKPGEAFPKGTPIDAKKVDATAGTVQTTFSVEPGNYAIAIFQDRNGNGKMDKNLFGVPKEPYGLSNNFRPRFSAPTFSDCQFSISGDDKTIHIDIN